MNDRTNAQIRRWMKRNAIHYLDSKTGEVNLTALVEAWDTECDSGEETLDSSHPAWDIAVEAASEMKR